MEGIEFTDRYSATGTPYPCPWTVCSGSCGGMGVYPTRDGSRGIEPKTPPDSEEDMGYWFVTCEECGGSGNRVEGKKAYYLRLLYTYWQQLWWPLWALGQHSFYGSRWKAARQLPHNICFMHRQQRSQREMLRARKAGLGWA